MFGLFGKTKESDKLQKQYEKMMEAAMHTQRSGDLKKYANEIQAAEALADKIDELRKEGK